MVYVQREQDGTCEAASTRPRSSVLSQFHLSASSPYTLLSHVAPCKKTHAFLLANSLYESDSENGALIITSFKKKIPILSAPAGIYSLL